jgi:hypothetical protein
MLAEIQNGGSAKIQYNNKVLKLPRVSAILP